MSDKKRKIIFLVLSLLAITGIVLGLTFTKEKEEIKETDSIKEVQQPTEETKKEDDTPNTTTEEENQQEENNNSNQGEEKEPENNNQSQNSSSGENNNQTSQSSQNNNQTSNNTNDNDNTTSDSNNPTESPSLENDNTDSNNSSSSSTSIPDPVEVTESIINLNSYSSPIKITKGGTYTLSGTLNYSVYIETEETITINLNGVTIKGKGDAAIANINTNNFIINLTAGTTNTLRDTGSETDYDATLYSNGAITITGDGTLNISGSRKECEGIATKNAPITINSGNITINSQDDGINTGGDGATISLNGGNVYVKAGGDGIDSNKDIVINGGTHYIIGSSVGADSGLDADAGIVINGGTILALGSDMLQTPESTSNQNILALGFNRFKSINTLFALLNISDDEIISYMSKEKFKTIIISSENLINGTYNLYSGGSHSGTMQNYIYSGGNYTKGTALDVDSHTDFEVTQRINVYTENTQNLSSEYYSINTSVTGKGTIDVVSSYISGTEIAFAVTPEENYIIDSIKIYDSEGNEIAYNEDYIFMMPTSDITITAVFIENNTTSSNSNLLTKGINNYFYNQSITTTLLVILSSVVFIICYKNKEKQN